LNLPRTATWTFAALAAAALAGCSDPYPLAPVSGKVTLGGAPLGEARVGFEPIRKGKRIDAGPGSYGVTDEEGRFELESLYGDRGAVIGEHRVWISTYEGKEGPNGSVLTVKPEKVPARYNSQTELTFTVPPDGTEKADFDLEVP
jgi:hypothetical protein